MVKVPSKHLTLSFTYFGAGPGLGGVSEIAIYWRTKDIKISFTGDRTSTEYNEYLDYLLPRKSTWREISNLIIENELFAFRTDGDTSYEFAWPDRIEIKGQLDLAAILITWTWAGPPLSDIITVLKQANDAQLDHLVSGEADVLNRAYVKRVIKWWHKLSNPSAELEMLINRRRGENFAIKDLILDKIALYRVELAELKATQARQNWALLPFEKDISTIVQNWSDQNPASSTATAMGKSAKKAAIVRYLKNYVMTHNALPAGKHKATGKVFTTTVSVEFNVDDLME